MIRDVIKKVNEASAKKPQLISDAEEWLKVKGYKFTVVDDKKYKMFKSTKNTGQTTLSFDTGKLAFKVVILLAATKKFKKLYVSWSMNSVFINWLELPKEPIG